LCQGRPRWIPEATFTDRLEGLASWPLVYRDPESGTWRMLYSSRWRPWTLMVAESDDGLRFRPRPTPDARPEGGKVAPHHIFTLPHGSCGGVYYDPEARDDFHFKAYGHQQGPPVYERAKTDPAHRWHEAASRGWAKAYMAEEVTLVSRDGIQWETKHDWSWGLPEWHPEPPIFGFHNQHLDLHAMTVRPGWGDRRVCLQTTRDFRKWSGPELLLQPDPLDEDLCELYGMPVFPYGGGYVGLLWMFHCEQSEPTRYFNRHVGSIDVQLACSFDGVRFFRSLREPFIPLNEPGEHGSAGIETACMIELEQEIRFYSSASKVQHGKNAVARKAGLKDFESILVHTLRRDGFMYLESRGSWASIRSKPLVLFDDRLTLNVEAPHGELLYRLTGVDCQPLNGFGYGECEPLISGDSLSHPLRWKERRLDEVTGRPVRLELKWRDARLYAVEGRFHFLDAQDVQMLRDGLRIDASLFDF
jgi:hypothetical protein